MSAVTTVIYLDGGGVISLEIAAPSTTAAIWTPKPYSSKKLSSGARTVARSTTMEVNQHGATATDDFTTDDIPISSAAPITTTNSDGQTIVYPLMTTTYTSAEGVYTSVLIAPEATTSVHAGESNGGDTVDSGILATSTIIAIVVAFVVGITGIATAAFCLIRSRRRRRRHEEAARRVAAEAKKEYDEKLPRPSALPGSTTAFAQGVDFSSSTAASPISPFGDEQRVRYDLPVNVVDHSADAASINMEHARAISVGRERRSRSRQGDRVPSRARTMDPRRRNDGPVVRELDSDRASARGQVIRTMPIRQGEITPFTLPPMPAPTSTTRLPPVLNLTIPRDTYHPDRTTASVPNWRRTSDIDTLHTLTTDDDDMLAEDGSSIARTLTTESGESGTFAATHGMFRSQHGHDGAFRSESPVAWGPGPFGDEHQSSGLDRIGRLAQQTDFDDASTIGEDDDIAPYAPLTLNTTSMRGTPTLLTGHSTSSGSSDPVPRTYESSMNPFADPASSHNLGRPRFARPPQSDAGRSETSAGGRTEASFRPGDDARSDVLHLGSRWGSGARNGPPARSGIPVTYLEDLNSEDDRTTPSDTIRRPAPRNPSVTTGDNMSTTDEDEYIRTLEGAFSCGVRTEDDREPFQLPPSYNEVFGNTF